MYSILPKDSYLFMQNDLLNNFTSSGLIGGDVYAFNSPLLTACIAA